MNNVGENAKAKNGKEDEMTMGGGSNLLASLAVLVRYRKMIAIGTLAVALLAIIWFGALPSFRLSRARADAGNPSPKEIAATVSAAGEGLSLSKYSFTLSEALHDVSYTVSVSAIPLFLKSYIENNYDEMCADLRRYFNAVFEDLSALAPICLRYNLWPPKADPATADESLAFVGELRDTARAGRETRIGASSPIYAANANTLYFSFNINELSNVDELSASIDLRKLPQYAIVPYEAEGEVKPPLALQFSRDVVAEANRRAEDALLPIMESIAADPLASPAVTQAAESFLNGYRAFFSLCEVPAMSPSEGGKPPAFFVAIAALLGFCALVLIAFLRKAVGAVRQDTLSMKKLEAAWEDGKKGL